MLWEQTRLLVAAIWLKTDKTTHKVEVEDEVTVEDEETK